MKKLLFAVLLCQHALIGLPSVYSASPKLYKYTFQYYNRETGEYIEKDKNGNKYSIDLSFDTTVLEVKNKIAKRLGVKNKDELVLGFIHIFDKSQKLGKYHYSNENENFSHPKSSILSVVQKKDAEELDLFSHSDPKEIFDLNQQISILKEENQKKLSNSLYVNIFLATALGVVTFSLIRDRLLDKKRDKR